jgi:hypothetical protein
MKKTAVLFDLDSTLRTSRHRHWMLEAARKAPGHLLDHKDREVDWHAYSAAGIDDMPMLGPITALRLLRPYHEIHIISGSNASAAEQTMSWLSTHVGLEHIDMVHLRADGDDTPAGLYKVSYARSVEEHGIGVALFWEDWVPAVLELEKAGYPVVCVNPRYPCLVCGADPEAEKPLGIGGGR